MLKKLFGLNKENTQENNEESKKDGIIYAHQNGNAIALEEVPDDMFAQKMLGDGIAIEPNDNKVYSPVDGEIISVAETKHAYGIKTDDELELLIHVGIDTVELNGEGFTVHVTEGQRIKKGELIAEANLEFIKQKGYNTVSILVITNTDDLSKIRQNKGMVKAGEDIVVEYSK